MSTALLRSEWVKLRSTRSARWALVGTVAAVLLLTAFLAAAGHTDATQAGMGDDDVVVNSLRGVYLGQLAVAAFAALATASETTTGTLPSTFLATPRRGAVLAAKAAVAGTAACVVGMACSLASFLLAQPLLQDSGYVPPAYPIMSLGDPGVARAIVGGGLYLAVAAAIGVALGSLLRGPAATGVVVAMLLLPSLVAFQQPSLTTFTPAAGLAILSTVRRPDSVPFGPWGGFGVSVGWAAVLLALAAWRVTRRDV